LLLEIKSKVCGHRLSHLSHVFIYLLLVLVPSITFSFNFLNSAFHDKMSSLTANKGGNKHLVAYISDLEGNYDYWNRYIAISQVLERVDNEVQLKDSSYHFIHGGDVCDRWKGDLRILRELLLLKRRYPDNIHFLLGNRDVNKLRLPVCLHETVLKFRPNAYWFPDNKIDANFPLNDIVARLKWVSFLSNLIIVAHVPVFYFLFLPFVPFFDSLLFCHLSSLYFSLLLSLYCSWMHSDLKRYYGCTVCI
jgi:hypothetical protein